MFLAGLERVDPDLVHEVRIHHRIGDVPAVRRPRIVEDRFQVQRDVHVLVGSPIHLDDLLRVHIDVEQAQLLVGETDLPAVRRPAQRVAIAFTLGRQLRGIPLAQRVRQPDLVLPVGIREVGDGLAVGRPSRSALARSGGTGQVSSRAFFPGQREDIAPRDEQAALAGGRAIEPGDPIACITMVRPGLGCIGTDLDGNTPCLAVLEVVEPQRTAQFVDDGIGAGAGPAHVVLGVLRVDRVEVEHAVPVGTEVDAITDPHGQTVGSLELRQVTLFVGGQVVEVDLLRGASAVPLPGSKLAGHLVVGDLRPVGRKAAGRGFVKDDLLETRSIGRDEVQPRETRVAVTCRREQDLVLLPVPAQDLIRIRVPRHTRDGPAVTVHDVDVLIAVVFTGERDARTVRREAREPLFPVVDGQADGRPAGSRHRPEILAVDEYDGIAMHGGEAQQGALVVGPEHGGCQ